MGTEEDNLLSLAPQLSLGFANCIPNFGAHSGYSSTFLFRTQGWDSYKTTSNFPFQVLHSELYGPRQDVIWAGMV